MINGAGLPATLSRFWKEGVAANGFWPTARIVSTHFWEFLLESTPAQRRIRYGDAEYDWDHRVDTTSATVDWRERLLGHFHSPYQATEPEIFQKMMAVPKIDFREFTFIDIGSGKGRVLLMAADYPFRRIFGIELLPALTSGGAEKPERLQERCRSNVSRWRRCVETPANLFSRRGRWWSICLIL